MRVCLLTIRRILLVVVVVADVVGVGVGAVVVDDVMVLALVSATVRILGSVPVFGLVRARIARPFLRSLLLLLLSLLLLLLVVVAVVVVVVWLWLCL